MVDQEVETIGSLLKADRPVESRDDIALAVCIARRTLGPVVLQYRHEAPGRGYSRTTGYLTDFVVAPKGTLATLRTNHAGERTADNYKRP